MKKVLFIVHQSNFDGGASRSLIEAVLELNLKKEVEPLFLLPGYGEISKKLKESNIKFIVSKFYLNVCFKGNIQKIKLFLKTIFNIFLFRIALYRTKKNIGNIDIFYTNTSTIDIGFYLSSKYKKRHIIHIREYGEEDHGLKRYFLEKIFYKNLLKSNNEIICISHDVRKKIEEKIKNKKINVVYNGIEKEINFRKKINIYESNLNLVIVGTISEGKNQLLAIKATEKLLKKGKNLKLFIIGEKKGDYYQKIFNYIKNKNLEKNIIFLGKKNKKEIESILNNCHLGLMLSRREAFGRVTVEYMLSKLAVIGSNSGGTCEIIEDNKTGLLFKSGDVEDLSKKINIFYENRNKIIEFGENGFIRAKKFFNLKTYSNGILNIIKN